MPTVRYQIRNEYGLADPELHSAADKDDPEAILEGVAMAGLVGVLRQLGDLAEFAVEVFRDLHEEVMGTAARGHGLMLRVQQLEAEFPSVEKSLFSQSSHSSFAYNNAAGIDWHCNVHMDQNLITQGDMPRFILDSYEECRGPPRLFTLDKFDTAGAGACLKRYSDPSFFKMELVSSVLMESDIPREKKFRKTRKKGSRWKNGQTLESLLSPHANLNLQSTTSDQVSDKSATRLVRLKSRNLNGTNGSKGVSLRKRLLELHSDEQKVVFDNSRSCSNINVNSGDSGELTSKMHDTIMDMSANHPSARDVNPTKTPTKVVAMLTTYELDHWKKEDEELSEAQHEPFDEVQNPQRKFNFVEKKERFADSENNSEGSAYDYELSNPEKTTSLLDDMLVGAELKLEGSTDGSRTEDIGSEQENFMDALNSMESEIEADSENKDRPYLGILIKEIHEVDFDTSERLEELQTEISELDSAEVSTVSVGLNNILMSGISSVPYSSTLSNLAEIPATQDKVVASNSSEATEFFLGKTHDESWEELLPHDDVSNSADMISGGTNNMKTFHSLRSDIREETCSSCVINSTSSLINIDSQEGFDALQLINANQNDTPAGHEAQLGGTDEISKCLDGSPHSDSCPVKPHHAEHVDELILEDMMEILEMPNDLSCSPTRSASIEETLEMPNDLSCSPTRSSSIDDPDNQDSSIMTVPTVKEMQHSMDRDTKAFPSKEDTAASSGGRSILTSIIAFVPDTSMDVVQHDGLVADINNGQHPEDLTIEASFDYVKGTDDVVQNMNGSFVGTEDDNVPCHPVELTSEEMSFRPDMSDHLSDAKHESSLAKDFGWYIEVPQHHSNVTIGKSQQSMNQDEGNSTETVSLPIHAIATIRDKDCMTEMENIVAVENQSYLRPEVGFENTNDMAESNLAMPEILQSQLEYFSDTEESRESPEVDSAEKFQESLKVNVAEEPQESPKVNSAEASEESPRVNSAEPVSLCSDSDSHTQESQEFSKVDLAEESQESPKMNSAEQVSSCSESETFSDRLMNPPVLVLDDLKLPNEFNQDNLQKNIQEVEQIIYVKNLSAEKFASEDETNNHDTSLVYTQEASGIQSQLLEDSTVDAAVSYQHPLKTHETCSPKMVEVLDSQNTLNMEVSSEVEQSALDPAASCSGLPAKDSSNANVAGLLGDICDMMPAEHVQAYLHTCVGDTYSEDPVQSKQEFGSKSLAQGHHGSAKQEMSLSTNLFSDSASLSEEVSTSQPSDEVEVEPELSHQKCEYLEHDIPTNSVDVYDKPSDGPEPSYHAILNNVKNNELDMLPSNTDLTKNLCSEALISSECSSEISACHMASNISVMTFSLLSSSDVAFTESASRLSYEPQSDEVTSCFPSQHPEGPPPLPPIEWRTQKVQLSTLLPDENLSQSLAETNPSMVPSDSKSANPFMAPPFGLSELLPNVGDQNHQHNALSLEGNIVHSLSASSSISLSLEHEKSLCAPDAQWGSKLPLADSFTPSPVLKSQISQHSASQEERIQPISDKRFQLNQLWPGSELEKSHHSELSHLNLEKEMIQPQNPFLVEYVLGDVNHHHNYGDFGGENVHLLKSSEFSPSLGLDMPHPSCVYSSERSRSILFGVVPTREDEWFSIKPHSILNRPRNPLIEAVVAHDRSTLRKVSELARPSNESKADKKDALLESNILQLRKVSEIVKPSNEPKADERDALLEQIRNKSFSLKPTVLSKPNTKGHPTNIKVAAIVEKANALRQAVAGSDEEDGGDSWSDC